ncbi:MULTISPECIES: hypothetical protein [unclassified Roseateles]|uniref:hypothetical protein n=1 Tax=unclassified Roseateles TaxID=2626991 RepID=UPI0006FE87D4|nr:MULTISPECIES: hypothetical protein [unclassified Roseateles]KQW41107.1 hypothetical protein ASC81_22775 [Pelomonas sp. Root405]KRA67879.1 hypothetical protein ASD88_20760 [Pelomonas sp. Root662]
MRRFTAIGSSHLFGLLQQYVAPMESGRFQSVWDTGQPFVAELPLGVPGWRGDFVLYNTPVAGPAPLLKERVLYIPPELTAVLGHIPAGAEVIFSLLRGQEFAVSQLVDDPSHADFIGDDGGFEAGRRWMSREDALAWVRSIAEPLLATHLALRQQFPQARIVHVPAPPPIEDAAHVLANAEGFGPLFAAHGVKPFAMRLRVYRLMYAELARQLAEHGITSLAPPVQALTPAGGLKAECARGCLHGNHLYAQGLAAQMTEVLTHVASL